jgi:hypothetical protein
MFCRTSVAPQKAFATQSAPFNYNVLLSWFVALNPDDPVWYPHMFTNNGARPFNKALLARSLGLPWAAPKSQGAAECKTLNP